MEFIKDLFVLLARLCISTMFLWAAYDKIRNWDQTVAYMKSKHIPKLKIVMPVFFGLKVIGALLVLFGWHTQIGAFFLILVTLLSLVKMHPFWKVAPPERASEISKFRKETAILGGLLLLLAFGAGRIGMGG